MLTLNEYKLKVKHILAYWDEHINFNSAEQILLERLSDKLQAAKTKHEFKIHFTAMKQFHNQYVKPVLQHEKDMNASLLSVPTVPTVSNAKPTYRNESDFDIAMRMATSFFKEIHVNTNPSTNDVVKSQQEELDYYQSLRK